jgi:hypothetical protein
LLQVGSFSFLSNKMIPKVHHAIWIQGVDHLKNSRPQTYALFEKWKKVFPDTWEHRIWSGDEIRLLLSRDWPELVPMYDACPSPSAQSDIGRYAILYANGGLYADTDFEPLRNFEWILNGDEVQEVVSTFYVSTEGQMFLGEATYNTCIIGASVGSRVMAQSLENIRSFGVFDPNKVKADHYAGIITGPGQISKAVNQVYGKDINDERIRVLPHAVLDPLIFNNLQQQCEHESDCRVQFPGSYGIHRMDGSWVPDKASVERGGYMYSCMNDRWTTIVIVLVIFILLGLVAAYLWRCQH